MSPRGTPQPPALAPLPASVRAALRKAARTVGTPCYVYFAERMQARFDELRDAFGGRFRVSYAVKANPNAALLRELGGRADYLDVSSIGEIELAIASGFDADRLTFSGPAKRAEELERAVNLGVGFFIAESGAEVRALDRLAAARGTKVRFLIRINPARLPRGFGGGMAGRPSQFGFDEEDLAAQLPALASLECAQLMGFHAYSGTNALSADAVVENTAIHVELFQRFSALAGVEPELLVFGAGLGIPYLPKDRELDLRAVAEGVTPMIDALAREPRFANTALVIELGRWLVGRDGYLVTRVLAEKRSRGVEFRICDTGFHHHLAACGMLGQAIRRDWRYWALDKRETAGVATETARRYRLTGPLCTAIDTLAMNVDLPELTVGSLIAIGSSGAYGLTASPTRFISHPSAREIIATGEGEALVIRDVSRSEA